MSFGIISWAQVLDLQLHRYKFSCFRDVIINYCINTPINHRILCWKVLGNKHIKTLIEIGKIFNQCILNDVLIISATICFMPKKMGYWIKRIRQVNYISGNRRIVSLESKEEEFAFDTDTGWLPMLDVRMKENSRVAFWTPWYVKLLYRRTQYTVFFFRVARRFLLLICLPRPRLEHKLGF